MLYNPSYLFLDSVWYNFVEEFCTLFTRDVSLSLLMMFLSGLYTKIILTSEDILGSAFYFLNKFVKILLLILLKSLVIFTSKDTWALSSLQVCLYFLEIITTNNNRNLFLLESISVLHIIQGILFFSLTFFKKKPTGCH